MANFKICALFNRFLIKSTLSFLLVSDEEVAFDGEIADEEVSDEEEMSDDSEEEVADEEEVSDEGKTLV